MTYESQNSQTSNPFNIAYRPDGVFLIINPNPQFSKQVLSTKILEKVTAKSIKNVDRKAIQLAVEKCDGKPYRIAEPQQEYKLGGLLVISISPDKMTASFNCGQPEDVSALKSNEILKYIYSKGIKSGINYDIIEQFVSNPRYGINIEFAHGTLSEKGDDGRVELLFECNSDRKPRILEDGSVDYHELNYVSGVKKGQILANIIQPKPGKLGMNILGQQIPALRGKPVSIPRGKNVEVVNNGSQVAALIDGYASYTDNKINVVTVLEVPGDVDMSTGNIRFIGSVIIKGNVLTDFVVEAGGNVEVHGVVEGATIRADGDIILKRGIQGKNKGLLVSGHDIIAKYIEHSNVEAKNDIKCEAIMHSTAKCKNIIELSGRKGLAVGGSIKAGKEIRAKVVGSPMYTMTDIEVGADPNLRDRYKEAKEKLMTNEDELSKTDKSIAVLTKLQDSNALTLDRKTMLNKLIELKSYLNQQHKELEEKLEEMEQELEAVRGGKIKIHEIIYPGVKVTIGSASKFIKESIQYTAIYLDGADIKSAAYDS